MCHGQVKVDISKVYDLRISYSSVTSNWFCTWVLGPKIGFWLNPELIPTFIFLKSCLLYGSCFLGCHGHYINTLYHNAASNFCGNWNNMETPDNKRMGNIVMGVDRSYRPRLCAMVKLRLILVKFMIYVSVTLL